MEELFDRSGRLLQAYVTSTWDRRCLQRRRRAYYARSAIYLQAVLRAKGDRDSVRAEAKAYYSGLMPVLHSGLGFFSNIGRSIDAKLGFGPNAKSEASWMPWVHRRTPSSDLPVLQQLQTTKKREPWWRRTPTKAIVQS